MTIMDAFAFTPKQMSAVEDAYQKVIEMQPEDMVSTLLSGCEFDEKKMFALGIMVGRSSIVEHPTRP